MKRLILFALIIQFTLNVSNAQWVSANGPYGATILCLTNSGSSVFAGTSQSGLFATTNNGANWQTMGFPTQSVYSLASNGNYLFAGTSAGISRSSNNGSNWTTVYYNSTNIIFKSLAANGSYIFAGTNGMGVLRSSNNGDNWAFTYNSISYLHVYSLLVNGTNIFAATNGGVFLSTDNGGTWTEINNGLVFISANALAVSGINLFLGTYGGGVFVSTVNGGNWNVLNNGLANWDIHALAASGSYTFLTNDNGVFMSNTLGSAWINRNQGFGTVPIINSLLIANNYIYAGTVNQSVWRRSLSEIITSAENVCSEIPSAYSLSQNYPNPFNPSTKIKFDVPANSYTKEGYGIEHVTLKVYDVSGRKVQTLIDESLKPGSYETTFDGSSLNSGVYFYRISAGKYTDTKSMILIK